MLIFFTTLYQFLKYQHRKSDIAHHYFVAKDQDTLIEQSLTNKQQCLFLFEATQF